MKFNLIRYRSRLLRALLRVYWLKFLGMKIGKKVSLGSITCEWPNKVFIGDEVVIQNNVDFRLGLPFDPANFIKVDEGTFIGRNCELNAGSKILIGKHCLIASNTTFVDLAHEYRMNTLIKNQRVVSKPIIVEDDVWIGSRCVVLQGVVIGRGSIVGAGSVVNKSIPP